MKKIIALFLPVFLLVLVSGCSSIATKSWGSAGSSDAFRIVTIDPVNGTGSPEITAGGGAHVLLFAKPYKANSKEIVPTMIGYARRISLWSIFAGDTSAGNVTCLYIAGSQETPDQTAKILEAYSKVVNGPDLVQTIKDLKDRLNKDDKK